LNFLKLEIVRVYGRDFPRRIDNSYSGLFKLLDTRIPEGQSIMVFTTNYDTVLESQIQNPRFAGVVFRAKPKLCTGFRPGNPSRWQPDVFDEPPGQNVRPIILFKLHGSVNWKWDSSTGRRLPVEMDWREPTGDKDCLIYFGYKSVPEDEPFKTLHDRLKKALLEAGAVVAIGFRFADPYIRETFDMALRANRELHIVCCLRSDPEPNSPVAELLETFPNRVSFVRGAGGKPLAFGEANFLQALEQELDDLR
jgi:hypothetical protein